MFGLREEYPEESDAGTETTCKVHTERTWPNQGLNLEPCEHVNTYKDYFSASTGATWEAAGNMKTALQLPKLT